MYDEVVERLRCQISTTRMHTSQLVSCVPSCSIRLVYVWELRLQLLYELVVCIVCIHIIYIISCILRARSILLPVVYTSKRNTSRMHILLSIMREYNTSSSLYIYLVYIVRISYRIVSYRIVSNHLVCAFTILLGVLMLGGLKQLHYLTDIRCGSFYAYYEIVFYYHTCLHGLQPV